MPRTTPGWTTAIEILGVDVDDVVELVRREDDAARDGDRAARATRAARARRDGDLLLGCDAKHCGDVLARLGHDDHVGHARLRLAVVLRVDPSRGLVEDQLRLTDGAIELDERALDAGLVDAGDLRGGKEHARNLANVPRP